MDIPSVQKGREAIKEEYMKGLVTVSVPKLSRRIYSTLGRLNNITQNADEYPAWILDAINRHEQESELRDVKSITKGCINGIF